MKNTSTTASTNSATLRYVTVFHAMWIPGLLFEDTKVTEKTQSNSREYGVLSRLPQGK